MDRTTLNLICINELVIFICLAPQSELGEDCTFWQWFALLFLFESGLTTNRLTLFLLTSLHTEHENPGTV